MTVDTPCAPTSLKDRAVSRPAADAPSIWMANDRWWLYGVHPRFANAFARFHARNKHHLRMAMTVVPELEQAASKFLWGKYLSNDPLKMYVAFRDRKSVV